MFTGTTVVCRRLRRRILILDGKNAVSKVPETAVFSEVGPLETAMLIRLVP